MVKCNRERLKEFDSQFTVLSDFDIEDNCEQILTDADFLDFKSDMIIVLFMKKQHGIAVKI